ncbi:MAG: hypothetical protein AAGD28_27500 [Bacteroidota bacterium]
MKTYRKLLYFMFALALLVPAFQACEEGVISPQSHAIDEIQNNSNGFFDLQNTLEDSLSEDGIECFSINFPIDVNFPDGSSQTFNTEDALEAAIDLWIDNNPNSLDWPEIAFPITVTLEDGSVQSIANDEELCDLHIACYGDEYTELGSLFILEEFGFVLDSIGCFDIVYPVDVVFPDSTTRTVNSNQELAQACEDWWNNNPNADMGPSFVYPIQVTTDSATITITEDGELYDIIIDCLDEAFDGEGFFGIGDDFEWGEEEELECFDINYPVDIRFPDGSTQSMNSENEVEAAIEAWIQNNPNSEDWPEFVFPITVTLNDGSTQTVNSDEELCDLYVSCWDEVFGD